MKCIAMLLAILLLTTAAQAAPIDWRSQRQENQKIQDQQNHFHAELKRDWEKYGTGPIPPKQGTPDWIQQNFGDQKILKNRQKYKKWQVEDTKKQKAKEAATSKGKIKKK